ncbi:hypothetical protein BTO06_11585 [Tenacibaculum sp. SZ-18]|uniref:beta strand repeat-containing protein n=1 Tax=Tenacibaculum sp. SZ-18 TaxID=754423 RepID=UPI000C2D19BF|nr:lamin tail domain-containing protein [Tenacibaculum sp. SZ-18]AUC15751.1 hypothetical protein BTO06_11585 [Tenacibaculum sp. SZ-18]
MRNNYLLIYLLFFLHSLTVTGQVINDDFEDGDLSGWTEGTVGHWSNSNTDPITTTQSLKHNLSGVSDESYIYHDISSLNLTTQNITWQFNLKNGNWDPSSSNRFWVYLTANDTDLNGAVVDGYALGVNLSGTSDILTLWKVTDGAADGAIISTSINWNSNETRGIRITRSTTGNWEIFVDNDGGFDTLVSQGTNTNSDYTFSTYFGLSFDFSSTRAGLLWMDDVLVEGNTPSTNPTVSFDNASSTENETNTTFNTLIPVSISNYSADVSISVSVDGSSTAEPGDYTLNTSSLTYTGNGTKNISLDINNDVGFDNETVILNVAVTSGTADLGTSQHTITIIDDEIPPQPSAGIVFITEVVDASDFNYDYLELYNNSNETVSLANSKLVRASASTNASEYVFDFGIDETTADTDLTIPPYGFLLITRGGTRTGFNANFGITLPLEVGYNGGNSNNFFGTGRRWRLRTGGTANTDDGTVIDDTGAGVGTDKDYRNIFTDTFIGGTLAEATPGALEYLVYNGGAWVNSESLDNTTAAKNAYIYDNYVLSTDADINDMGIQTGQTFTINTSGSLDINGNLTTNNGLYMNSASSLIVSGSSTGNITYTRNLPTTNWYLVSAPVSGETQEDVIANHTFATGTGSNIGIGAFTNNGASPWVYATAATTGALTSGLGVSMKLAAAGDVTISGTINSSNVNFPVATGTRNNFNLVGNPFTSYVNSATFTSANTALLSEETVWLWDGTAYVTYNAMTPTEIAPAQGFFVEAGSAGNVTFATSNQSHQNTDTFKKSENLPSLQLLIEDEKHKKETKVFYANDKTTGFDNGYDSKMFSGVSHDFAVFTQLISNDKGNKLAIQTLPTSDIETMVVPVGLIADSNKEITFSVNTKNLPQGINVYLEDRLNNTFVNLSEDNHTVITKSAVNGIGQYYLHTTSARLSNDDIVQDIANVSVYKSANNEITIAGLQAKGNVKVFSLLGEELVNTDINSSGLSKIALPNLSTGVYVVKLNSILGNITKKIILE